MQYDTQKVALLAEMLFQWSDADGDDVLQDDEINEMIDSVRVPSRFCFGSQDGQPQTPPANGRFEHPWARLGRNPDAHDHPEEYKRLLRAIVHRADKRRKLQDGTGGLSKAEWERLIGETVFAG